MASKSDTKKKTTTKKATTKKASTPKKTSTKKTTTVKKNTVKKVEPVKVETKKARDAWYKHPILVGMISIALCYIYIANTHIFKEKPMNQVIFYDFVPYDFISYKHSKTFSKELTNFTSHAHVGHEILYVIEGNPTCGYEGNSINLNNLSKINKNKKAFRD